jgi:predicted site-specific integrase-resolvase
VNLLKYSEVAERLQIKERTARRIGARGEILEVRPSPGVLRVTAESVDLYLAQHLGPKRKAMAA